MTKAPGLLSVAILSMVLLAACGARSVRIAQVKSQPSYYDDKTISVDGIVTTSFGIPLVPFQLYNVDDGTGEITVLSRSGRAPSKGAHVRVTGKVNEVAVSGGRSVGLHIRESNLKIRG